MKTKKAKKKRPPGLTPYEAAVERRQARYANANYSHKFKSKDELQLAVDDYFLICEEESRMLTVCGLALHLDMTTAALRNYSKRGYRRIVNRAKQVIEGFLEERLQGTSASGTIFNLKNNFKWVDKLEHGVGGPDGGPLEVTRVTRTIVDASEDKT